MRRPRVAPGWSAPPGARLSVAVAVISIAFPLAWVLRVATKTAEAYTRYPDGIGGAVTFSNFVNAWHEGSLGPALAHTLYSVPLGAVMATAVAAPAGFAFAKLEVPLAKVLFGCVVAAIAVPLPAIIIPLFNEGLRWHYTNSYVGLAVVFAALYSPWATYFLYSTYRGLPDALVECARLDGAGNLGVFLRVAVPLSAPALATVFAFNFLAQWSNILLQLVLLPSPGRQTMLLSVSAFSGQYGTGAPVVAAGYLEAALPLIVLYSLLQKFVIRGIYGGALKE